MPSVETVQIPVAQTTEENRNIPASLGVASLEHDAIAQLAYVYWQMRGCPDGSAEEDWLRAEQDLQLETLAATIHGT